MDKSSSSSKGQQDQVQAIYLAQANIFAYEARKSNKSWVPLCDSTVPISILYDNTRSIYRIISVDADIKEVVVNTTIIPELEFVKTTQKFGYWKDVASGRVFGIGFASEFEAEAFDECLRKVKQNIGPPSVHSSVTLNASSEVSSQKLIHHDSYQSQSQGQQGDGSSHSHPTKLPLIPPSTNTITPAPSMKKMNWDDYEQVGPTVLSFLNSNRQQLGASDGRPSTYKVDLPVIGSTPVTSHNNNMNTQPSKLFTTNLDELRLGHTSSQIPPAPSAYHPALSYPYYSQQLPPRPLPQASATETTTTSMGNSACSASGNTLPSSLMPSANIMPLTMSLPHGFCYQGPTTSSGCNGAGDGNSIYSDPTKSLDFSGLGMGERRDLKEEINRIKTENIKLSESLIESTCNAKKWELQVNSLREDNISLVKSVADLNSKVDQLNKECREYKEQASRWKEHYQQAVTSAKEKGQHLKEAEEKLKSQSSDKQRLESVMKDLEEELKRQQQINKEHQAQNNGHVVNGQYTNKYFKELEDHYRKLLSESQKKIEDIMRKDGDRKNILRGVDTLFTGAIQGLINIHGQIRQAYEQ